MDPGDRGVLPDPWHTWLRRTAEYGKYLRPGSEDRDVRMFSSGRTADRFASAVVTDGTDGDEHSQSAGAIPLDGGNPAYLRRIVFERRASGAEQRP